MPKSSRVATTTRERMSRPSESVPNQCFHDGGDIGAPTLLASGSYGTIHGPAMASSANRPNSTAAAKVSGFSPSTWRQCERGGATAGVARMALTSSTLQADARIHQPVHDVDRQIE